MSTPLRSIAGACGRGLASAVSGEERERVGVVGAVSFKARVIMRQAGRGHQMPKNQKPEIRNQNQTASPKL